MDRARSAFLACTDISMEIMAMPEVRERWDAPSVLKHWSVSGLAAHLVRSSTAVEEYLNSPLPDDDPIGPAAYYAAALDTTDLDSELHRAIRRRGDEMAAQGYDQLIDHHREVAERLKDRLATEAPERKVRVFKDLVCWSTTT